MFSALLLLSYALKSSLSLQRSETPGRQCYMPISQIATSHNMSYERASRNKWSLLRDLPLELRLCVYGFCFPTEWIDLTVISRASPSIVDECDRPVQLLRTCRAIRIEAEPVLRRNTIFVSDTRFLTSRHQPTMRIEHLEIELDTFDFEKLHECDLSVPPGVKSLQLIYRPYDCYSVSDRTATPSLQGRV